MIFHLLITIYKIYYNKTKFDDQGSLMVDTLVIKWIRFNSWSRGIFLNLFPRSWKDTIFLIEKKNQFYLKKFKRKLNDYTIDTM